MIKIILSEPVRDRKPSAPTPEYWTPAGSSTFYLAVGMLPLESYGNNNPAVIRVPELPDIELYVWKLSELLVDRPLLKLRVFVPFVLRTVAPTSEELVGRKVQSVSRIGKRIAI